jgi:MerR HTH family regulatory protein
MEEAHWTLDELAERVDAALAVDYPGQPSGRVRDVPDRRAIRWYTTIGLIDRPVAHRGRTALYGPRHLLQLVAVKRLQARGLPLVAIQQELAGATDTELGRVARLPATAEAVPAAGPEALAARDADPGPPAATSPARPSGATGAAARRLAAGPARRATFWRDPPVAALTAEAGGTTDAAAGTAAPTGPAGTVDEVAGGAALADPEVPGLPAGVATLRGIRLAAGATLLLEPGRDLDAADLDAILDAARPLLAVLRDRRLAGMPGPAPGSPAPGLRAAASAGPASPAAEPAPPGLDLPRRRAADGEPRREHP